MEKTMLVHVTSQGAYIARLWCYFQHAIPIAAWHHTVSRRRRLQICMIAPLWIAESHGDNIARLLPERKSICKLTFQCARVGSAVTFPSPSVLYSSSVMMPKSDLPLSAVERRVSARAFSKGPKLLCLLDGGVRGEGFTVLFGGSVGRRTAGT